MKKKVHKLSKKPTAISSKVLPRKLKVMKKKVHKLSKKPTAISSKVLPRKPRVMKKNLNKLSRKPILKSYKRSSRYTSNLVSGSILRQIFLNTLGSSVLLLKLTKYHFFRKITNFGFVPAGNRFSALKHRLNLHRLPSAKIKTAFAFQSKLKFLKKPLALSKKNKKKSPIKHKNIKFRASKLKPLHILVGASFKKLINPFSHNLTPRLSKPSKSPLFNNSAAPFQFSSTNIAKDSDSDTTPPQEAVFVPRVLILSNYLPAFKYVSILNSKSKFTSYFKAKQSPRRHSRHFKSRSFYSSGKRTYSRKSPNTRTHSRKSSHIRTRFKQSPNKQTRFKQSLNKQTRFKQSPYKQTLFKQSPNKQTRFKQSPNKQTRFKQSPNKQTRFKQSPNTRFRSIKSPNKRTRSPKSPNTRNRSLKSPNIQNRSAQFQNIQTKDAKFSERHNNSTNSENKHSAASKSFVSRPQKFRINPRLRRLRKNRSVAYRRLNTLGLSFLSKLPVVMKPKFKLTDYSGPSDLNFQAFHQFCDLYKNGLPPMSESSSPNKRKVLVHVLRRRLLRVIGLSRSPSSLSKVITSFVKSSPYLTFPYSPLNRYSKPFMLNHSSKLFKHPKARKLIQLLVRLRGRTPCLLRKSFTLAHIPLLVKKSSLFSKMISSRILNNSRKPFKLLSRVNPARIRRLVEFSRVSDRSKFVKRKRSKLLNSLPKFRQPANVKKSLKSRTPRLQVVSATLFAKSNVFSANHLTNGSRRVNFSTLVTPAKKKKRKRSRSSAKARSRSQARAQLFRSKQHQLNRPSNSTYTFSSQHLQKTNTKKSKVLVGSAPASTQADRDKFIAQDPMLSLIQSLLNSYADTPHIDRSAAAARKSFKPTSSSTVTSNKMNLAGRPTSPKQQSPTIDKQILPSSSKSPANQSISPKKNRFLSRKSFLTHRTAYTFWKFPKNVTGIYRFYQESVPPKHLSPTFFKLRWRNLSNSIFRTFFKGLYPSFFERFPRIRRNFTTYLKTFNSNFLNKFSERVTHKNLFKFSFAGNSTHFFPRLAFLQQIVPLSQFFKSFIALYNKNTRPQFKMFFNNVSRRSYAFSRFFSLKPHRFNVLGSNFSLFKFTSKLNRAIFFKKMIPWFAHLPAGLSFNLTIRRSSPYRHRQSSRPSIVKSNYLTINTLSFLKSSSAVSNLVISMFAHKLRRVRKLQLFSKYVIRSSPLASYRISSNNLHRLLNRSLFIAKYSKVLRKVSAIIPLRLSTKSQFLATAPSASTKQSISLPLNLKTSSYFSKYTLNLIKPIRLLNLWHRQLDTSLRFLNFQKINFLGKRLSKRSLSFQKFVQAELSSFWFSSKLINPLTFFVLNRSANSSFKQLSRLHDVFFTRFKRLFRSVKKYPTCPVSKLPSPRVLSSRGRSGKLFRLSLKFFLLNLSFNNLVATTTRNGLSSKLPLQLASAARRAFQGSSSGTPLPLRDLLLKFLKFKVSSRRSKSMLRPKRLPIAKSGLSLLPKARKVKLAGKRGSRCLRRLTAIPLFLKMPLKKKKRIVRKSLKIRRLLVGSGFRKLPKFITSKFLKDNLSRKLCHRLPFGTSSTSLFSKFLNFDANLLLNIFKNSSFKSQFKSSYLKPLRVPFFSQLSDEHLMPSLNFHPTLRSLFGLSAKTVNLDRNVIIHELEKTTRESRSPYHFLKKMLLDSFKLNPVPISTLSHSGSNSFKIDMPVSRFKNFIRSYTSNKISRTLLGFSNDFLPKHASFASSIVSPFLVLPAYYNSLRFISFQKYHIFGNFLNKLQLSPFYNSQDIYFKGITKDSRSLFRHFVEYSFNLPFLRTAQRLRKSSIRKNKRYLHRLHRTRSAGRLSFYFKNLDTFVSRFSKNQQESRRSAFKTLNSVYRLFNHKYSRKNFTVSKSTLLFNKFRSFIKNDIARIHYLQSILREKNKANISFQAFNLYSVNRFSIAFSFQTLVGRPIPLSLTGARSLILARNRLKSRQLFREGSSLFHLIRFTTKPSQLFRTGSPFKSIYRLISKQSSLPLSLNLSQFLRLRAFTTFFDTVMPISTPKPGNLSSLRLLLLSNSNLTRQLALVPFIKNKSKSFEHSLSSFARRNPRFYLNSSASFVSRYFKSQGSSTNKPSSKIFYFFSMLAGLLKHSSTSSTAFKSICKFPRKKFLFFSQLRKLRSSPIFLLRTFRRFLTLSPATWRLLHFSQKHASGKSLYKAFFRYFSFKKTLNKSLGALSNRPSPISKPPKSSSFKRYFENSHHLRKKFRVLFLLSEYSNTFPTVLRRRSSSFLHLAEAATTPRFRHLKSLKKISPFVRTLMHRLSYLAVVKKHLYGRRMSLFTKQRALKSSNLFLRKLSFVASRELYLQGNKLASAILRLSKQIRSYRSRFMKYLTWRRRNSIAHQVLLVRLFSKFQSRIAHQKSRFGLRPLKYITRRFNFGLPPLKVLKKLLYTPATLGISAPFKSSVRFFNRLKLSSLFYNTVFTPSEIFNTVSPHSASTFKFLRYLPFATRKNFLSFTTSFSRFSFLKSPTQSKKSLRYTNHVCSATLPPINSNAFVFFQLKVLRRRLRGFNRITVKNSNISNLRATHSLFLSFGFHRRLIPENIWGPQKLKSYSDRSLVFRFLATPKFHPRSTRYWRFGDLFAQPYKFQCASSLSLPPSFLHDFNSIVRFASLRQPVNSIPGLDRRSLFLLPRRSFPSHIRYFDSIGAPNITVKSSAARKAFFLPNFRKKVVAQTSHFISKYIRTLNTGVLHLYRLFSYKRLLRLPKNKIFVSKFRHLNAFIKNQHFITRAVASENNDSYVDAITHSAFLGFRLPRAATHSRAFRFFNKARRSSWFYEASLVNFTNLGLSRISPISTLFVFRKVPQYLTYPLFLTNNTSNRIVPKFTISLSRVPKLVPNISLRFISRFRFLSLSLKSINFSKFWNRLSLSLLANHFAGPTKRRLRLNLVNQYSNSIRPKIQNLGFSVYSSNVKDSFVTLPLRQSPTTLRYLNVLSKLSYKFSATAPVFVNYNLLLKASSSFQYYRHLAQSQHFKDRLAFTQLTRLPRALPRDPLPSASRSVAPASFLLDNFHSTFPRIQLRSKYGVGFFLNLRMSSASFFEKLNLSRWASSISFFYPKFTKQDPLLQLEPRHLFYLNRFIKSTSFDKLSLSRKLDTLGGIAGASWTNWSRTGFNVFERFRHTKGRNNPMYYRIRKMWFTSLRARKLLPQFPLSRSLAQRLSMTTLPSFSSRSSSINVSSLFSESPIAVTTFRVQKTKNPKLPLLSLLVYSSLYFKHKQRRRSLSDSWCFSARNFSTLFNIFKFSSRRRRLNLLHDYSANSQEYRFILRSFQRKLSVTFNNIPFSARRDSFFLNRFFRKSSLLPLWFFTHRFFKNNTFLGVNHRSYTKFCNKTVLSQLDPKSLNSGQSSQNLSSASQNILGTLQLAGASKIIPFWLFSRFLISTHRSVRGLARGLSSVIKFSKNTTSAYRSQLFSLKSNSLRQLRKSSAHWQITFRSLVRKRESRYFRLIKKYISSMFLYTFTKRLLFKYKKKFKTKRKFRKLSKHILEITSGLLRRSPILNRLTRKIIGRLSRKYPFRRFVVPKAVRFSKTAISYVFNPKISQVMQSITSRPFQSFGNITKVLHTRLKKTHLVSLYLLSNDFSSVERRVAFWFLAAGGLLPKSLSSATGLHPTSSTDLPTDDSLLDLDIDASSNLIHSSSAAFNRLRSFKGQFNIGSVGVSNFDNSIINEQSLSLRYNKLKDLANVLSYRISYLNSKLHVILQRLDFMWFAIKNTSGKSFKVTKISQLTSLIHNRKFRMLSLRLLPFKLSHFINLVRYRKLLQNFYIKYKRSVDHFSLNFRSFIFRPALISKLAEFEFDKFFYSNLLYRKLPYLWRRRLARLLARFSYSRLVSRYRGGKALFSAAYSSTLAARKVLTSEEVATHADSIKAESVVSGAATSRLTPRGLVSVYNRMFRRTFLHKRKRRGFKVISSSRCSKMFSKLGVTKVTKSASRRSAVSRRSKRFSIRPFNFRRYWSSRYFWPRKRFSKRYHKFSDFEPTTYYNRGRSMRGFVPYRNYISIRKRFHQTLQAVSPQLPGFRFFRKKRIIRQISGKFRESFIKKLKFSLRWSSILKSLRSTSSSMADPSAISEVFEVLSVNSPTNPQLKVQLFQEYASWLVNQKNKLLAAVLLKIINLFQKSVNRFLDRRRFLRFMRQYLSLFYLHKINFYFVPFMRLLRIGSPLFNNLSKLSLILLERFWLPAQLVFRFVHVHLRYRRPLFRLVQMILSNLCRWFTVRGVKVVCAGRFIRSERASYFWRREGKLPLNTVNSTVEYFARTFRSRYGIGCVKIWIYRNIRL